MSERHSLDDHDIGCSTAAAMLVCVVCAVLALHTITKHHNRLTRIERALGIAEEEAKK